MLLIFEDCTLDVRRYELRRAGKFIPLRTKVFQVLAYLAAHHDRVVSRDELKEQVWSGQFIADATLSACIKEARRVVGDTGRSQRVIKTIHGQGYHWITDVRAADDIPHIHAAPWSLWGFPRHGIPV